MAEHCGVTRQRTAEAMRLYGDLVRVVHGINQAGARELRDLGFTPAQYQLLSLVDASPECSQQQTAERLGVTKGNVSMLVTRLEDAGLIDRIPDGAAYGLRLTGAGREALARIRPLHAAFLANCFAGLDDEEMAALGRLVAKLDSGS